MVAAKPLHEGLFSWPAEIPNLIGSQCLDCGEYAFPKQNACRACSGQNMTSADLGNAGNLWTWTVQSFMPKTPYHTHETQETFTPYGVGYIEMACGLKVESRLRENSPELLKIGMPMKLEIITVRTDDEGSDLLTFQFCAAEEQS